MTTSDKRQVEKSDVAADVGRRASNVQKISHTARAILDVRARRPGSSLADLYAPLAMPPALRAAHETNDRAVLAAYGLAPVTPEGYKKTRNLLILTGCASKGWWSEGDSNP